MYGITIMPMSRIGYNITYRIIDKGIINIPKTTYIITKEISKIIEKKQEELLTTKIGILVIASIITIYVLTIMEYGRVRFNTLIC